MAQVDSPASGTEQPARSPTRMDASRIEDSDPSLPLRGAGIKEVQPNLSQSPGSKAATLPTSFWLVGWALVIAVWLTTFGLWGPEMEFPTTVSSTEVKTDNGGTLVLEKTVRELIGGGIDDAVDWVTREASWLFDGMSNAVAYALVTIEDTLKWVPWPAVVVALAFLSFAVGRWQANGVHYVRPAVRRLHGSVGKHN